MKVEVLSLPDFELHDYQDRDVLEVRIDGKRVFSIYDSYPQDANLKGSFADCKKIDVLMQMAYDAGKRGEKIEFIKKQVPGDILWKDDSISLPSSKK